MKLQQYFYVYELQDPDTGKENIITERITFFDGYKPAMLDIPGWKGWLEDLIMAGEIGF